MKSYVIIVFQINSIQNNNKIFLPVSRFRVGWYVMILTKMCHCKTSEKFAFCFTVHAAIEACMDVCMLFWSKYNTAYTALSLKVSRRANWQWIDGRIDGWINGWTEGPTDRQSYKASLRLKATGTPAVLWWLLIIIGRSNCGTRAVQPTAFALRPFGACCMGRCMGAYEGACPPNTTHRPKVLTFVVVLKVGASLRLRALGCMFMCAKT